MESWQEKMLEKHDKDLYHGNGKSALTTRVTVLEDAVQRIASNWKAIVLMFLATLLTAVANFILHFFGK
jgi:hypothetical protein